MKYLRIITLAAFAGILLAPIAKADEWNKKTIFTIDAPVRLPSCCNPEHSVTLKPGTYVMVLVSSQSDRHIVRVFKKDGITVVTTILAIPNYRLKATSKTKFTFWETPVGETKAMRAWFYPGDNFGQEFAYPKETAVAIAAFVKAPVPTVAVTSDEDLKTTAVVVAHPDGGFVEPVKLPEYVAPVATADAAVATPAPAPEAAALPATASTLPLIGLLGLLSMMAFTAMTIRSSSKR